MKKPLFVLVMLLALSSAARQTATTPAAPPAEKKADFKNLLVFPKDIPRDQLLAAMRGFTRGLGVRCDHCHVQIATEPKPQFDFPADTKPEKRAAREMIRMAAEINGTWIPRVRTAKAEPAAQGTGPEGENPRVSCWTCHRGKTEPDAPPPPPEPQH